VTATSPFLDYSPLNAYWLLDAPAGFNIQQLYSLPKYLCVLY